MTLRTAFIGFGEAGQSFAGASGWLGAAAAFDILTDNRTRRAAKRADYRNAGVTGASSLAEALTGAQVVLSLVTADQALRAATDAASVLPKGAGALYLDLNSVAPATKRAAAATIAAAGGRYADVAVMAPVHPARLAVPLLVSGEYGGEAADALRTIGFATVRTVAGGVGQASTIKMLRSVVVKGVEALTAECLLAAARAGVVDEVLDALGGDWRAQADYNLDRMLVHGLRRAAEMQEVVATLDSLSVAPLMTRATAQRQRELGSLGLGTFAELDTKLAALADLPRAQAA